MKSDITRDTFDLPHQFSRVLMQQGRVQLDADWNEQTSITLHFLHTLAADLIGPYGGPGDILGPDGNLQQRRCGFKIIADAARLDQFPDLAPDEKERLKTTLAQAKPPFLIGNGRYYVDGLMCENPQIIAYADQLGAPPTPSDGNANLAAGTYLVYLDVWERLVTFLDDDSIREVALNGADTAARAEIAAQVRVSPMELGNVAPSPASVHAHWADWKQKFQPLPNGQLRARVKAPSADETGPCLPSPLSGYRGAENQLYRVEIHQSGAAATATFKWSRDNGSVVTDWTGMESNELETGGVHDSHHGFRSQDWVELSDDEREFRSEPGKLVQLTDAQNGALTISNANGITWSADLQHPKVRRWDQKATENQPLQVGAIPIVEGQWMDLEDGIQVWFEAASPDHPNQYRSGDYWLIPARTATGDVEWPFVTDDQGEKQAQFLPPRGIKHHYAPLAIIAVEASGAVAVVDDGDCRRKFPALAT